ncbi:MAG: class I SAM-dependent methyltransferase [Candidatus Omnitrophica bacterium]|nr:class I SAM-dependent methyltransferase [Candidatus Omnitrophota bacterium]
MPQLKDSPGVVNSIKVLIRNAQRRWLDTLVARFPKLGLDQRAEYFVSLFEKDLPSRSRVLDIGGGWGFYSEPLRRRGHWPTVLDVVKPGIQKSPLVIYDGKRIPFPDKSFDVSLFVTVLHHVPDPEALLNEASRVTRKQVILIEDIYRHGLGRFWTEWRDRFYNFEFIGHPANFRKSENWIQTAERRGWRLIRQHKVYTWLSGLRIWNGVFIFEV